nr:two-component regulator propeller domain-containing protein [Motiliproteus sediminis]
MDWKGAGTLGVVAGGLALAAWIIGQGPSLEGDAPEPVKAPVAQSAAPAIPASAVAPATPAHSELPKSKFVHYRVGSRNVKSMYADADGIMWVGTSGGVVRYDVANDDYRHYDVRNGLLANGVFHVSRIGNRVAVGTYGGGLAMYDEAKDQWQVYNVPEGLGDAFVYDVLQSRNGDIWIATWTGVNRVKGGKLDDLDAWEVYTVDNTAGGLPNDWVYGLAEGKNGEIWLATEGGLARYTYGDGGWANWKHVDGLGAPYEQVRSQNKFTRDPADYSSHHARQKVEQGLQNVNTAYNPNYIVALSVAPNGDVWAGTWGGGLSRFDGEAWHTLTVTDGLPSNHVFMLHHDRDGQLWVGTSHGLARQTESGFKVFTTEDGLYSNTVFSMATQADGALWIGSFGGVARITELP